MEPEEIADTITSAFTPYKCEVQLWDFKHRVRFRILDKNDTTILKVDDLDVTGMNRHDIEGIVEDCKSQIREKEFII